MRAADAGPRSIEEAVADLKRDPAHPVQARVGDLDLELRVLRTPVPAMKLGDELAAGPGWQGESVEELLRRIRDARDAGTTPDPR